jgi:hypothetical protein
MFFTDDTEWRPKSKAPESEGFYLLVGLHISFFLLAKHRKYGETFLLR